MILILGAAWLFLSLAAVQTSGTIDINGWRGSLRSSEQPVLLNPGEPMLPYLTVNILLPFGESYENAICSLSPSQLVAENADIPLAVAQQPISPKASYIPQATPKAEDRLYPEKTWEFLGTQYYRGYQIALFNIYPYQYNPITRDLYASTSYTLNVESSFSQSEAAYQANFFTNSSDTASTLGRMIANLHTMSSYQNAASYRNHSPQSRLIDLGTPKKMIIITNADRTAWFSDYAAWRNNRGISNIVVCVEDIYSSYQGTDNAAKVRNFIIDAYQSWAATSTPLEYVILGGDDEIVPERSAFGQVGDTIDPRMPVDIYYSNLDGNWNANGNDVFGEQADDTDLIPEIHIGRFPAQTQAEFDNIFRKTRYYVDESTFSNNIAQFFGENLNNNPMTWGGDYKDDVALHLPQSYDFRTMYQRDGTYSELGVWNAINNGAGVMNHMGHANEFFLLGQSNGTIENLENSEYGFLYSQGCYPAAFDQRTSGDSESIAEHLVTADGALFAFLGNTRYGWYAPGSINGASQYFDRQYFIGLYEQNLPQLGKALTYSRMQNLNAAMNNDVMRWCYFEVVLFGDPSVAVKPANPSLPYLSLQSYTFSDIEGDNNGEINPNEIIRLYPIVANHEDWGTAYNVHVQVETGDTGIQVLDGGLTIPQIYPGGISADSNYLRMQMPAQMGYGTFTLTLVLDSEHQSSGASTGEIRYPASFEITMMEDGFPWETLHAGKSAPLIGNFNATPEKEILFADVYGSAYLVDAAGNSSELFDTEDGTYLSRSFASGPLDAEAGDELVFCSRNGDIYALTATGSPVFRTNFNTLFIYTPVLADVDGNGALDVIAGGMDGKIYALSASGTLLPGFPFEVGGAFQTELAAADLNNDNAYEIIGGGSEGNLYVISASGNVMPGFPIQLNGSLTGAPTITNRKLIACATSSSIYLISPSGQIIAEHSIDTHIAGGFALGDVDQDHVDQEIAGISLSGRLYVINDEGHDLPGFPLETGANFSCPPLLANLDSDPQLEILVHSYVNSVYGYNHDGSVLSGFPFISSYNGSTPATLVDLEANNSAKLVMGHSNGVMMLNLRTPATGLAPWITYRGSALRQGSFASTGCVGSNDEVEMPAVNALKQNYPNPFFGNTTIAYSLKRDAQVHVEIYNLKGQRVYSWKMDKQKAGSHQLQWDGKDMQGNDTASGIYLYKLTSNGETLSRRMLRLK